MTKTTADSSDMDNDFGFEAIAADRIARRVLEGRDPSISWQDAGYTTAEEAAAVLIGDDVDGLVRELAIEAIAAVLTRDY